LNIIGPFLRLKSKEDSEIVIKNRVEKTKTNNLPVTFSITFSIEFV
jgi:hypothetical protein